MTRIRSLAVATTIFATAACGTSGAQYHVTTLPGSRIRSMKSFYVVHRDSDPRHIERDIAQQLVDLGYQATSGPTEPADPDQYDAVVTYIDRYMWDMSMYCLQLTLYVRDTRTGYITATASSWRPSLVRKTPAGHAKILLTELLGGDGSR
jgi:hypothetical protein